MSDAAERPGGRTVELAVDLTLSSDGDAVDVRSTDGRVLVDAPTLSTALRLLGDAPPTVQERVIDTLGRSTLAVEVRVRDVPVATLTGSGRGLPERLLGVPGTIHPFGVATAAVRGLRGRSDSDGR
ncbi:MAG: hypothetical protein V5A23_06810 [Halobacteriales archaeon]